MGAVLQSLFGVLVIRHACRDQIDFKTKFEVKTHMVELISVNTDRSRRPVAPLEGKGHYKVKEHELID